MRRAGAVEGTAPAPGSPSQPGGGLLGQGFGVGEAVGLGADLDDRAVEGEAVDDGSAEPGSVMVFVQPLKNSL